MKRLLTVAAACLAVTASTTLPAFANAGRSLHGTIASLDAQTIGIKARSGIVTTCALGKRSPAVASFAVGDSVVAVCAKRGHGPLTLTRLRSDVKAAGVAKETEAVRFGGAITALDDASISLHDGDRDLTCTLGPSSPSTAGFKVGQHATVECAGGVLVKITAPELGRLFTGSVASVTDQALTVQTEHGPVSCTITPTSPSTASLKVGDKIAMGCRASTMELVLIRALTGDGGGTPEPSPTPPPPTGDHHTELKARGAVTTIGDGGVTLHTDGGLVSCTTGPSSPSLDGFKVGDLAAMECVDGVLSELEHVS